MGSRGGRKKFCQTPVQVLGLGVDFVLPLSQEEQQEEQQQEQEPHQNIPEGNILEVLNLAKSHTKPNQTHATLSINPTTTPPPDINPALLLQKTISDPKFFLNTPKHY